ncbi:MAG: ABC transporter substrate-binding protein [Kiritimatiellae bacterium]|nr:ABC transporter substrate-binding protein [Kiritimatiellia bacterium]
MRKSIVLVGIALFVGGLATGRRPAFAQGTGAGPAASSFTLGAVLDLSNETVRIGLAQKFALELAVARLNAAGGAGGRAVRLAVRDTRGDPATAAAQMAALAREEGAVAIIGPTSPRAFARCARAAGELQVPLLCPVPGVSADPPGEGVTNWAFLAAPSRRGIIRALCAYLKRKGPWNVALVVEQTHADVVPGVKEDVVEFGLNLLAVESFTRDDPALAARMDGLYVRLLRVRETPRDRMQAVLCWGGFDALTAVGTYVRTERWGVTLLMAPVAGVRYFVGQDWGVAKNVLFPGPKEMPESAVETRLAPWQALVREEPKVDAQTIEYEPALFPYILDAAALACHAAAKAGFERAGIRDAIRATDEIWGFAGVYDFTRDGMCGLMPENVEIAKIGTTRIKALPVISRLLGGADIRGEDPFSFFDVGADLERQMRRASQAEAQWPGLE